MSGAGSERQLLLAGFANEIQPLLAMVAGAIDRLLERPGDATAAAMGLAQLQTVEGAASMLEVPGFEALLRLTHSGLDALIAAPAHSAAQRVAARALTALLLRQGEALGEGQPAATPPAEAATLLAQLQAPAAEAAPAGVASTPADLESWLSTLTAEGALAELSAASAEAVEITLPGLAGRAAAEAPPP